MKKESQHSIIDDMSTGTIGSPDILLSASQIEIYRNTTSFYLTEISQHYTTSSKSMDNNPAPWNEILSIIP